MIDWVSFFVDYEHDIPIHDGYLAKMDSDGNIISCFTRYDFVQGSYDDKVVIKSDESSMKNDHYTKLYISGNPSKFLQGHNLFGSDDLNLLINGFFSSICQLYTRIPINLSPEERFKLTSGQYRLTRVDCTYMYDVGSLSNALSWLRQAEKTATLSHRGRGQLIKGSTLYFGKNSKKWSLKIYAKGEEFKTNPNLDYGYHEKLVDYANKSLRVELTIRSQQLKKFNLEFGCDWCDNTVIDIHKMCLKGFNMSDITYASIDNLDELSASSKGAYAMWEKGIDLRTIYSKAQFYRHRKNILDVLGIDIISVPQNLTDENVIPFVRFIEAVPMGVPGWAVGTDLYYEPKKIA